MKSLVLTGLFAGALAVSVLTAAPAPADSSDPTAGSAAAPSGTEALCFVPKGRPQVERTIHVPRPVVDRLIRVTWSYRGPCASYGESAPRGDGTLTAYAQSEDGVPHSIGVAFGSSTLEGLPHDPPTAGLWCYDKNDDGTVDEMTECAGGYENALDLSDEFRDSVDTPFTYLLINWNPHGHMPPGVYNLPHFDIHFYLNSNAERLKIRPGPCPALVNCDDYVLGKRLPESKYRTKDHLDLDAVEPAMGNHLVDTTGPEFHGERFTHTFIYGTWDGDVTFYEPMVTHEWFSGLADGTRKDTCTPIKLPQAWERSGWYPTQYCLRYRENRDELTASLEEFVYRQAS